MKSIPFFNALKYLDSQGVITPSSGPPISTNFLTAMKRSRHSKTEENFKQSGKFYL